MSVIHSILVVGTLLLNSDLLGCTGFLFSKAGQGVVAKSHDWGDGGVLMSNRRGVVKKAMRINQSSESALWTADYGSITYTMFGKDLPVAGMNEMGLTVEMFVLKGAQYPNEINKPALNEFQWVQYILDTSATLDEAIANSQNVVIEKVSSPIHYLVCSASSECAVFEYIKGRQRTYTQSEDDFFIPVLSNSAYKSSLEEVKKYDGFGGDLSIPEGDSSLDRFVKAAFYSKNISGTSGSTNIIDDAFARLTELTWHKTSWHFVFQPYRRAIWFRRPGTLTYSMVNLSEFDFRCRGHNLILDIGRMDELQTTNNWRFTEFSVSKNREILNSGLRYVDWRMTDDEFEHIVTHSSQNTCVP